jgi:D-alanyl-D-alanine carboxypeptidase (penicillin-binding protein 5/6)
VPKTPNSMDMEKLKVLAENRRNRRQAGYALLLSVSVLALFVLLVPHQRGNVATATVATSTIPNAFEGVSIAGHAAIVYDITTGQTLYAYNADAQLPLASLTKLLTLYAASKVLNSNSPVAITPTALAQTGAAGDNFSLGEQFTFDSLARYTLVSSSNQGAQAIAEAAASKQNVSATNLLAGAASAAGLSQTYAINGTGLDESTTTSGGYGSARDIAILAGHFLSQAPDLANATTKSTITVQDASGSTHSAANTDKAVLTFPRLLLSKTGNTDLAGGNLAVVFDAGVDHPIAIVVLGSSQAGRFSDVQTLMDATLAQFADAGTVSQ